MTATAAWSVEKAVALVLGGIHPGQVFQENDVTVDDSLPYDIIGSMTEPGDSRRSISQPGLDQTLFMTFWAADTDTKAAKQIAHERYAEGKAALDGAVLTLPGYGKTTRSVLSLIRDTNDPPGQGTARGVIAQLTTSTIQA